jgi:hypothetical protein
MIKPNENFKAFISSPSGLETDRSIVIEEIESLAKKSVQYQAPAISIIKWPDDIGGGCGRLWTVGNQ